MTYKIMLDPFGQYSGVVRLSDNLAIPNDPENTTYKEYLAWVDEGNTPEESDTTHTTADEVRRECERRLGLLVGARDSEHLKIIQLKAMEESISILFILTNSGTLTDEQKVRITELLVMRAKFVALRACSNILEQSLPEDYKDDAHWQIPEVVVPTEESGGFAAWFRAIWS